MTLFLWKRAGKARRISIRRRPRVHRILWVRIGSDRHERSKCSEIIIWNRIAEEFFLRLGEIIRYFLLSPTTVSDWRSTFFTRPCVEVERFINLAIELYSPFLIGSWSFYSRSMQLCRERHKDCLFVFPFLSSLMISARLRTPQLAALSSDLFRSMGLNSKSQEVLFRAIYSPSTKRTGLGRANWSAIEHEMRKHDPWTWMSDDLVTVRRWLSDGWVPIHILKEKSTLVNDCDIYFVTYWYK